jgi:phage virion morphogenesis protein
MAGARERITIEIDDAELRAQLSRLTGGLQDLSPVMREIGEVLTASTKARFGSQTDPEGRRWEDNSPVTLARKSSPYILTEHGYLGGTIRPQLEDAGQSVAVGTDRVYGAMQQFGGTKAQWPHLWGDIPARPFLGISDEDRTNILEILRDYLQPA